MGEAQAKLGELGTAEAKQAFIDNALSESLALRADVEQYLVDAGAEENGYDFQWDRICTDLVHWETELRRTFKRDFPDRTDIFFDSEDDLLRQGESAGKVDTAPEMLRYLERREDRLRQIRKERTHSKINARSMDV